MKAFITGVVVALGSMAFIGCSSQHEEGVKSNMMSQWAIANADTMVTTEAAKAVLTEKGLMDVSGSGTMVDGTAKAKKADGTEVKVSITKKTSGSSQIDVSVGMMGEPSLGAEIAKAIKMKAESMPAKPM